LDVHQQIECAQTLASRFYTDPAILEIEKARIFRRTWQLVGTLSQSCGEVNGIKRTISDPEVSSPRTSLASRSSSSAIKEVCSVLSATFAVTARTHRAG